MLIKICLVFLPNAAWKTLSKGKKVFEVKYWLCIGNCNFTIDRFIQTFVYTRSVFYLTLNVEWSDEEKLHTSALIKYNTDVLYPTYYSYNTWHNTTSQQILLATVHWAAKAWYHKVTPELFFKKTKIRKKLLAPKILFVWGFFLQKGATHWAAYK